MFIERSSFLFIFPDKPIDTLVAYHRYPISPRSANDLFGRPLFFRQFFDNFLADAVGKAAFSPETFLAFIGVFLRQACGIAPLMAVSLEFSTNNTLFPFQKNVYSIFISKFGAEQLQ
jgi:hypothetical protein